jgi:CxxC motif-containing protein (DUF1111 family)
MRASGAVRRIIGPHVLVGAALALTVAGDCEGATKPRRESGGSAPDRAVGEELFFREWAKGDPRAHGGDGLGPMFNERSCVACHGQKGPGGAGPNSKNVRLLTVTRSRPADDRSFKVDELLAYNPGFRDGSSVVLHRQSTQPGYEHWLRTPADGGPDTIRSTVAQLIENPVTAGSRRQIAFQSESFSLFERNTPPLFGMGLMDSIPEEAIVAASEKKFPPFPEITGRVGRLSDGRVGRFGWKAQVDTLENFVLAACAGELGLEVPGHRQSIDPRDPSYRAPAPDMTEEECDALVWYVAALPAPEELRPRSVRDAHNVPLGRSIFNRIGCSACHSARLGPADEIFSDLLLHDMGSSLSDSGAYYGSGGSSPGFLARGTEWRTPPLWGLRDSAPYLHDGRAPNLESAIRWHGGEATSTAQRYARLQTWERRALHTFLNSLVAPKPSPEWIGRDGGSGFASRPAGDPAGF